MKLKVKLTKGHNMIANKEFDSGYDLLAKGIRRIKNEKLQEELIMKDGWSFVIAPNETVLITTGVHLQMPEPVKIADDVYEVIEAQLRGRSGLSLKTDTNVKLGTIDNGYRHDCGIIFHNESDEEKVFHKNDALGQIIFNKVIKFMPESIEFVEELDDTDRGISGFGASGLNK